MSDDRELTTRSLPVVGKWVLTKKDARLIDRLMLVSLYLTGVVSGLMFAWSH